MLLLGYVFPINHRATTFDKLGIPLMLSAIFDPWIIILGLMYCQYDPIGYLFEDLFQLLQISSNVLSFIAFLIRLQILTVGACECSRILGTVILYLIILLSCANRILNLSRSSCISSVNLLTAYRTSVILFQILVNQIYKPISLVISALFFTLVLFWWLLITQPDNSGVFIYLATILIVFTFSFKIGMDLLARWGDEIDQFVSKIRQRLTREYYAQENNFATTKKIRKVDMLRARATRPVRIPYYPFQDIDYPLVANLLKNGVLRVSDAVLLSK